MSEKKKSGGYAPINRKTYWVAMVIIIIASTAAGVAVYLITGDSKGWPNHAVYIVELFLLVNFQIRRLHDANKPAGFAFFNLVPLIGPLAMTIIVGCLKPNHVNNKWM